MNYDIRLNSTEREATLKAIESSIKFHKSLVKIYRDAISDNKIDERCKEEVERHAIDESNKAYWLGNAYTTIMNTKGT